MSAPRIYASTDTGAPVLTGQVGSFLALLNAILINGYGAIPGAGWSKPLTDANNQGAFKAATSVANHGTLPGAGHILAVNDNNPNATSLGREAQIRAWETLTALIGTGTGPFPTVAQEAVNGLVVRKSNVYETITTLSVASGVVPISAITVNALAYALASGSTVVLGISGTPQTLTLSAPAAQGATSISVNSFTPNQNWPIGTPIVFSTPTTIPWKVWADDRTVYGFIDTPDFTGYGGFAFGEFYSDRAAAIGADPYRSLLIGRSNGAAGALIATDSGDNLPNLTGAAVSPGNLAGHYVPRNPFGDIQSAVAVGKSGSAILGSNQLLVTTERIGNGQVAYPNPSTNGALCAPITIHDSLGGTMNSRGHMRGFWQSLHPVGAFQDGDQFSGQAGTILAGKTFVVIKPIARGDGLYVLETSDTVDVN